ncbi:Dedicator of cytokinesis protein 10 [Cichlidogyrus casuarinus]|uniref:Dedicator of cytokinesis protein 10 n=1 Tax=Cichlidogyrus casuarinus TaxID=1844966 RepID=A0ABD2QBQ4_9PLAT
MPLSTANAKKNSITSSVLSESSEEIEEMIAPQSETTSEVAKSVSESKSSPKEPEFVFDSQKAILVLNSINERSAALRKVKDNIYQDRKEIVAQIGQTMRTIKLALDKRQNQLEQCLDSDLDKHTTSIEKIISDFEFRSQRLNMMLESYECNTGNEHQTNTTNHSAQEALTDSEALENLLNQQKRGLSLPRREEVDYLLNGPICMHPSENDTLSFFPSELDRLLGNIRSLGSIGISSAEPGNCLLEAGKEEIGSMAVRKCELNELVETEVICKDVASLEIINAHAADYSVALTPKEMNMADVKIVSYCPKEFETHQQFMNIAPSKIKLVYNIGTPGLYELNVKVLGEHIRGSPYMIWCKKPKSPQADQWLKAFEEASTQMKLKQSILQRGRKRYDSAPKLNFWQKVDELAKEVKNAKVGNLLGSIEVYPGQTEGDPCHVQGVWVTRDSHVIIVEESLKKVQLNYEIEYSDRCLAPEFDGHVKNKERAESEVQQCIGGRMVASSWMIYDAIFEQNGTFQLSFGEPGTGPGQLMKPIDVAETINGNYLISDFELHCVNVFSPKGKYISRFGERYLNGPKGIAVDSKGRILVVDQRVCCLCIFKPTGKYISKFGTRGQEDNSFILPTFIAVNAQDDIFIADTGANAVKIFDQNGAFLKSVGKNGALPGQIHHPMGIAVDSCDNIYLVDQGNSRIQVLTREDQFLCFVEFGVEKLEHPIGIALTRDQTKVIVTDSESRFLFICENPAIKAGADVQLQ